MKIISFLNSKGGVGKTTLAINLSRYLYLYISGNLKRMYDDRPELLDIEFRLPKILLVDADPQGSVRDWKEAGIQDDVHVIAADRRQTLLQIPAFIANQKYDYVVIDTPGRMSDICAAAIAISDICLIPVQPSPYDIWASKDITDLIIERQTIAGGYPDAFYVLNCCVPNSKIGKEVTKHLQECPFETIGVPIVKRVVYADSAKNGETIFNYGIEGAWDDMTALGVEVIKKLGGFEIEFSSQKKND